VASPFFSTGDSKLERGPGRPLFVALPLADQTAGHIQVVGENDLADVFSLPDRLDLCRCKAGIVERRIVCLPMAPTSCNASMVSWMAVIASLRYLLLIRFHLYKSASLQQLASCFSVSARTCFAASLNCSSHRHRCSPAGSWRTRTRRMPWRRAGKGRCSGSLSICLAPGLAIRCLMTSPPRTASIWPFSARSLVDWHTGRRIATRSQRSIRKWLRCILQFKFLAPEVTTRQTASAVLHSRWQHSCFHITARGLVSIGLARV
jgi:hypothetical protein